MMKNSPIWIYNIHRVHNHFMCSIEIINDTAICPSINCLITKNVTAYGHSFGKWGLGKFVCFASLLLMDVNLANFAFNVQHNGLLLFNAILEAIFIFLYSIFLLKCIFYFHPCCFCACFSGARGWNSDLLMSIVIQFKRIELRFQYKQNTCHQY